MLNNNKNTNQIFSLKKLSIIMPVYNGEDYIEGSLLKVIRFLNHEHIKGEIIVVDDGSKDSTYQVARRVAKKLSYPIKVVGYRNNMGKGHAFLRGFKESAGDIIALLDSDLDIPPEQIKILLKIMERTNADIVITNKWHPQSQIHATKIRKLLSKAFNLLVRLLTGLNIKDTQTGAKTFKRQVLEDIFKYTFSKKYAFDVELLLTAKIRGYKIAEAPSIKPIELTSKFKIKDIINMLLELLSITYRHRILGMGKT